MLADKYKIVCNWVHRDNFAIYLGINIPVWNELHFSSHRIRSSILEKLRLMILPLFRMGLNWEAGSVFHLEHGAVLQLSCSWLPNVKRCIAAPRQKRRAALVLSAFLLSYFEKHLKTLSCHARKMSFFPFMRILHWDESNATKLVSLFLSFLWLCRNFNFQTIYVELFGNRKLWALFLTL